MPPVKCRSCGRLTPEAVLCMYCGKHLEDQVACPKCSRKLIAGSKSCQYCGAEVVRLPPPDVITCRKCGRKMAGHLERCQICGTPSPRGTVARPAPAPAAAPDPAAAVTQAFERAMQMMETDRAAESLPLFDQLLGVPGIPERPLLFVFRATALKRCGRVPEALQAVQQSLQLSPEQAGGWSCAADCFLASGDAAKAEKAADRSIGCSDQDPLAWIVKGLCQKGAGRKAEALQSFERAVAVEPRSARGWSELGALADELGRPERAAEAYGRQLLCRHIGLSPANLRAARRIAELYAANLPLPPGLGQALGDLARDRMEGARFDEAVPLLDAAVVLAPKDADVLAMAAGVLFVKPVPTEEEILRAARWIDQALAIDPANELAVKVLGFIREIRSRPVPSAVPAKPTPPATPRDTAVAEGEKGQKFFNAGMQEEGLRAIDRALAADPSYHPAWYGKGSMLLRLGRYADAIPCYDRALALQAGLPTALAERATCLVNLGKFQEAIETADRSLALDKDKPDALLPRAGAFEQTGKFQEALRDYSRFLTLADIGTEKGRELIQFGRQRLSAVMQRLRPPQPKWPATTVGPLLDQALEQQRRGVSQDALATYRKATATDPFSVAAWINQASCLSELGRFDEAVQSFERAKKLKPDSPGIWTAGAAILSGAGRDGEALAAAEKATSLDPYEAGAWANFGALLNAAGRRDEALAALERTMLLDPFNVIGLLNYAGTLHALGKRDEAIFSYKRFLAISKQVTGQGIEDHIQTAEDSLRKLEQPGDGGGPSIQIGSKPIQQIGDRYDIYKVLGKGGCGIVYLAIMRPTDSPCALKTFLHEHRADPASIEAFKREAQTWIGLDRHPNIVAAYAADEVNGKLYLAIELVIPAVEGLTTLEDYLKQKPPGIVQTLRWAIQFCHGMEYAHSRGIRSHRDIKPANILIDGQKRVKISDFGLATAATRVQPAERSAAGTATHMPPEQFQDGSKCDARSDVYAFGVTLHQMVEKGRLPYVAERPRDNSPAEFGRFFSDMRRLHLQAPLPELDSPLAPVIRRCLAKEPKDRYASFSQLRADLEPLLRGLGQGETVPAPSVGKLESGDLLNKALSLDALGSRAEALRVCDQMIAAHAGDAAAWGARGLILTGLDRGPEALAAYDKSLSIDPRQSSVLSNKAGLLYEMKRVGEALACADRAIEADPEDSVAWRNRALFLTALGRAKEADASFEQGLKLNPNSAEGWVNRAKVLCDARKYVQSADCIQKALALDDRQSGAWQILADIHLAQGRFAEALEALDRCIEINPGDATAHCNRGGCLNRLNRGDEAAAEFKEAVRLDFSLAMGWNNLGDHHKTAGRYPESLDCFEKALARDPKLVLSLWGKASVLRRLGRPAEALPVLDRALAAGADPAVTTYLKGECHQAMEKFTAALECYQGVIAAGKAGQNLLALSYFHGGECLRDLGDRDRARPLFEQATKLDPHNAEYQMALLECGPPKR